MAELHVRSSAIYYTDVKQGFTCLQTCCCYVSLLLYVWFFQAIALLTIYNTQVKTKDQSY